MTDKQLLVYGARIRLAWFQKAKELGSVSAACRYYGIPRRTYYYWHKRFEEGSFKMSSLYDRPRKPITNPKDINEDKLDIIIQLRLALGYGEDKLSFILKRDFNISISPHGIHNALSRAGMIEKRKRRIRKTRLSLDRVFYPGEEMQLDVKHWKRSGYQYDIIDAATRIKFKLIYDSPTPMNTVDFLNKAKIFFAPAFSIKGIKTDNGTEFVYDHFPQIPEGVLSPFQQWIKDNNIEHIRIPTASPHLNGRIERSHGVDKRLYRILTSNSHSKLELNEFAIDDCLDYNFYRPHSELNMKTPIEYLQSLKGYENASLNVNMLYETTMNVCKM
jgi:transposase InsO family protein